MASGDSLALLDALSSWPPTTGYPQIDLRNGHVVLDFDDSAVEATDWLGLFPRHYTRGDLVARLTWTTTSATTGAVRWRASLERHAESDPTFGTTDLDVSAFGAPSAVTASAPTQGGAIRRTDLTIAWSAAQNPEPGETFRLRIERVANDAGDTIVGDVELLSVELREG